MLCLKIKGETVDLRWPRGRHLVLVGPRHGGSHWITLEAPGGRRLRSYELPPDNGWLDVDAGGFRFRIQTIQRRDDRVRFDVPPECEVARRKWRGRRAS